ncbi:putative cytosolic purine 5'-nucleotidase-like [Capsicum annuum]|nr:putative cytosolic purine 5'-nucleotidase-like [Capsicum annuum]
MLSAGPKEWLRDQKKKTAKYLLAPIDASRNILRSAYLIITRNESEFGEKELEEFQSLLRSAARDCVPTERSSFVQFQSNSGVEVCTFRLVVKNASSLLADKDPVKLAAETKLTDLIRSFSSLSDMANEIDVQVASNRQKVANAVMDTVTCLDNFEQGIKECLEDDTEPLAILQRIGIANWLLAAVLSVSSSNYTAIVLDSSMIVADRFHTMQRTLFACRQ